MDKSILPEKIGKWSHERECLVDPGWVELPTPCLQNLFGKAILLILRHG
jgi:hypothetical protein